MPTLRPPKYAHVLSPEPGNVTLYGKKDFVDVIKLRVWRWRELSELSRRAQVTHVILIRQRQGVRGRGEGRMMMEAEMGVMFFEDEGRGQKPRNIGDHQKLERTRRWIPPRAFRRN